MNIDDLRDTGGDPRPAEIVEVFWPYDGPHGPGRTVAGAATIGRLVRYLNNATRHWGALPGAPHLAETVTNLASAVYGLQQLAEQLAHHAAVQADDPTLYDDRRHRTGRDTARDLALRLQDLRADAMKLAVRLEEAAALASHLGHDTDEPGSQFDTSRTP